MNDSPLVSVIIPVYNTDPRFLREAVDSVLQQTYPHWEILLVNDGSGESSTAAAREYAAAHPEKIFYLEHPGRLNRGIIASRRLGAARARGKYIAFLDADDVWLPKKLAEQVAILESRPEVGMLYGKTRYWHSWTGDPADRGRDFSPELGLPLNRPVFPPQTLVRYLEKTAAIPCPCSVIIRREVVETAGCFESDFPNMLEDQMFYSRICLIAPVQVSDACWDWYRLHPASICAASREAGDAQQHYRYYLNWLAAYLEEKKIRDPRLWMALRRQLWLYRPRRRRETVSNLTRRLKKWILRAELKLLPEIIRRWIWKP